MTPRPSKPASRLSDFLRLPTPPEPTVPDELPDRRDELDDEEPEPATAERGDEPDTTAPTTDLMAKIADSIPVPAVAEILDISQAALRVRISSSKSDFPKGVRLGRQRFIPRADLIAWAEKREAEAKAEARYYADIRRLAKRAPRPELGG